MRCVFVHGDADAGWWRGGGGGGGWGGGEGAAGVEPAELLQQVLRVQPVRRGAGAHLVRPVRPRRRRAAHDAAPLVATFTNYKPLGWKCQCRDRLFDP